MRLSEAMKKKSSPLAFRCNRFQDGVPRITTNNLGHTIATGEHIPDMALLAHWYNVGPKLLREMEDVLGYMVDRGCDASTIEEVIIEANEVEGM